MTSRRIPRSGDNCACGHCGFRGACWGVLTNQGGTLPWCPQCERNDKLTVISSPRRVRKSRRSPQAGDTVTIRGPEARCPRGLKGLVEHLTPRTVWLRLDNNPIPESVELPTAWCPVDLSREPEGIRLTTKRWHEFREALTGWQRQHRPGLQ